MKALAEPQAWYCTIADWEGIPHPGNIETWNGTVYQVQSATPLEHSGECWCDRGSRLVLYWPLAWLANQSEFWRLQQQQSDAVQLSEAAHDCDMVLELTS